MNLTKRLIALIFFINCVSSYAQTPAPDPAASAANPLGAPDSKAKDDENIQKPNGKRIRRQLNLVVGLDHDEEFLIPDKETVLRGRTEFFEIQRITGTDYFRIHPKKIGSGIATLNDRKTGQILVEIRFDIRDDAIERTLREIQGLLADIDGLEYRLINPQGNAPNSQPMILIDGFVMLPKDLIRIYQVISNYPQDRVKNLATLSPLARQKIAEFITRDVNNPEVKISAVGNFIKLEGQVNNKAEHDRIKNIVKLFLPDLVFEKAPISPNDPVQVVGRTQPKSDDELIVDLITERPAEDKVEPPPKLIQIVTHFVKFNDSYSKNFRFSFAPAISAQGSNNAAASNGQTQSTVDSTINLLNNLLPKLQFARFHGFAKVLDSASILVQDKQKGTLTRTITTNIPAASNGVISPTSVQAGVTLSVTPSIKSERSGLIELKDLNVTLGAQGKTELSSSTSINTTISVRDRQSAAFGGIIKKSTDTSYGAPADDRAIITFDASKEYARVNSQFVVFVTPIIKSSASTGVDQVKKKFRLRD